MMPENFIFTIIEILSIFSHRMTFYRASVIFNGNNTILRRDLSARLRLRSNGTWARTHAVRTSIDNFLRRDKP